MFVLASPYRTWMALIALVAVGGCRDVSADGFPASVSGSCPPGFTQANQRCYRAPPGDGASSGADGTRDSGAPPAGQDAAASDRANTNPPVTDAAPGGLDAAPGALDAASGGRDAAVDQGGAPPDAFVPCASDDCALAATAIAAAHRFACAVLLDSSVKCWGGLPDGDEGYSGQPLPTPVDVSGATALAGGRGHMCALTAGGAIFCWGSGANGQLGDGAGRYAGTPVRVAGLAGATAIAASADRTCALVGGAVHCWGASDDGLLGSGTPGNATTPFRVPNLTGVTGLAVGGQHVCAVIGGGALRCWGRGGSGQLGNGSLNDSPAPVPVSGLTGVTALATGRAHSCAAAGASRSVSCWGYNFNGQLGNDGDQDAATPVAVAGVAGATALAATQFHTWALVPGGAALCWGTGCGGAPDMRHRVDGLGGASALAVGDSFACALLPRGPVRCWGSNQLGQLGNGTLTYSSVPVPVARP